MKKKPCAAVAVCKVAATQRTDHRTGKIGRSGEADFSARKRERAGILQHGADGTFQRHFQAVDRPARAECEHHEPVKAAPWQAIEPGGDVSRVRLEGACAHEALKSHVDPAGSDQHADTQ